MTREAIETFISQMQRRGWKLASKDIRVRQAEVARDLATNAWLTDTNEFRVRAIFKYDGPTPERVRIEVPSGAIQKDPEQTPDIYNSEKDLHDLMVAQFG